MKKLVFLLVVLVLFSSCFFQVDKEADGVEDVKIELAASVYNLEEIKVELENKISKKIYSGSATKKNDEINTLIFEKIPYGFYNLNIYIYKNNEVYSKISDNLIVAFGEKTTFKGVVGAPINFDELGLKADAYFISEYEKGAYYLSFSFDPVRSNYVTEYYNKYYGNLTSEEKELDNIVYKLYLGLGPDLDESNFVGAIDTYNNPVEINYSFNRSGENPAIDYMENNHIFTHENDEYVGKTLYWKVVAENSKGTIESEVHFLVVGSKTYEEFKNSDETKEIDLIGLIDTIIDIADFIDWLI